MASTALTTSTALLRPGPATGRYPQQPEARESVLERAAAQLGGLARRHTGKHPAGADAFIARVAGHERTLHELGDVALRRRVAPLRQRLTRDGFRDDVVAESFALVREFAARTLGLRPYDVQLLGGWILLRGMLAEMQTGEGKTLTATLPACTAALAGIPVHVVTVNDYLVRRDSSWMKPLYEALGLTVGQITEGQSPGARRAAYACDVTYCTNKQVVFDYLRDRLTLGNDGGALRMEVEGLRPGAQRADTLLLRGLCFAIVDEADSVLVDEARTPLILSRGGSAPQAERTYREALSVARALERGRDFRLREREREAELSDAGRNRVAQLCAPMGGIWSGSQRREELVRKALSALHLFELDRHYMVSDDKVQIIDEYTGRVMPDRSWEQGLHQMIEAKEGCTVTAQAETIARISYQRFFRRYLRLAGMTGTAREVARELWAVYRLKVVTVPTNRPLRRTALPQRTFRNAGSRWAAVVSRVHEMHTKGRAVLVGTRSVAASEHLSELLQAAGIEHQVLNARQDRSEADIVARAGERGRVTVATNMAGRGTDINLGPGVAEAGGLHVIATERHDARRIDRQLFGRCARQGDPGSHEAFVSLDDELLKSWRFVLGWRARRTGTPLPGWLSAQLIALSQRAAEWRHARMRRDLLTVDERHGDLLAFTGRGE